VSLANGATSTITTSSYTRHLTFAGNALYATNNNNNIVNRIDPISGALTGFSTLTPSTGAITSDATDLWVAACSGACNQVVRVPLSGGATTTFTTGAGSNSMLTSAGSYLYALDFNKNAMVRVAKADGSTVTIAGTATANYGDGTGSDAWFNQITGISTDGTSLWVSDSGNYRFRRVAVGGAGPVGGACTPRETISPNPAELHAKCVHGKCGDPIDTFDGSFSDSFSDLAVPGRGPALKLDHSYSTALASVDGLLGRGWSFTYGMRLTFDDPVVGSVTVHQESGAEVTFAFSGGVYTAPPRVIATLVHNGDGTWTFKRSGQEIFDFNSTGQIIDLKDLNGYATTVTRPSSTSLVVTEPAGRTLTFTLSGTHITNAQVDGASPAMSISFTVNAAGDLVEFTTLAGGRYQLTYDANHLLLTKRDPKFFGSMITPTPVTTNVYDASSRVTSQTDPLGRVTTMDYTTVAGSTIITDPKGNKRLDTYTNGLLRSQTSGYTSAIAATSTYVYDLATLARIRTTNGLGKSWVSTVDSQGNTTSTVDPLGRARFTTYNGLNEPVREVDGKGVATTRTYDTAGNPLTVSAPLLDGNGAVVATQTTTTNYGENGNTNAGEVTSVTDPLGKKWSFTYDAYGNRTSVTDPLAHKATATFNLAGWRMTEVSPRGNETGANPATYTTTYAHDPDGLVTSVTDPLGHVTQQHYDANRNRDYVIDPDNNRTDQDYDAANQATVTHRPDLTTTSTDYWPDGTINHQTDGAGEDVPSSVELRWRPHLVRRLLPHHRIGVRQLLSRELPEPHEERANEGSRSLDGTA